MNRILVFIYGMISYLFGLGALINFFGFMGNLSFLPKTIDSGPAGLFTTSLVINISLIALFGIQHTIMARMNFKKALVRFIPAASERSTFVFMTGVVLSLIMWQWRPMPSILWNVENSTAQLAITVIFWGGWALVVLSSFLINHFELFGLQQIWFNLRKKSIPSISFKEPFLYTIVRHPIMLGILIGIWFTPLMSTGHLVFSLAMTCYILFGVRMEERDLILNLGEQYINYKAKVPGLIPFIGGNKKS